MTRFTWLGTLVTLSAACDLPTASEPPRTTTPLESVPFEAIGPGKVLFQRIAGDGLAWYLIDGSAQTSRIAFNDPLILGAAISPDGQRVAFSRFMTDPSISYDLFVSGIDGSGSTRLTQSDINERHPTWVPDGTQIVYYNGASKYVRQSPVANTSDVAVIVSVTVPGCFDGWGAPAVVSARGELSFPCRYTIHKTASNGQNTTILYAAADSLSVFAPAWSADGRRLAFLEAGEDSLYVRVMGDDGSSPVTLATLPTVSRTKRRFTVYLPNTFSMCWSTDDSRLFFSALEPDERAHIWVVLADGTGLRQLTTRSDGSDINVSCAR